jgi:hypothetical protein
MKTRIALAAITCAIAALTMLNSVVVAENRSGLIGRNPGVHPGRDKHVGFIQGTGRVDPHARYSNDVAYEFGTVSKLGNKQIPYVERCYWTARPGFFILPTDIKQVCTRYTLENTPE